MCWYALRVDRRAFTLTRIPEIHSWEKNIFLNIKGSSCTILKIQRNQATTIEFKQPTVKYSETSTKYSEIQREKKELAHRLSLSIDSTLSNFDDTAIWRYDPISVAKAPT
jgi:hypothetical protein